MPTIITSKPVPIRALNIVLAVAVWTLLACGPESAGLGGLLGDRPLTLGFADSVNFPPEEAYDTDNGVALVVPPCTGVLTPAVSCVDEIVFAQPATSEDGGVYTSGMLLWNPRDDTVYYLLELGGSERPEWRTLKNTDVYQLRESAKGVSSTVLRMDSEYWDELLVAVAISRGVHLENEAKLDELRTLRDAYLSRPDADWDAYYRDEEKLLRDMERHCYSAIRSLSGQFGGCLEFNPARADEMYRREADLLDRREELRDLDRKSSEANSTFSDYARELADVPSVNRWVVQPEYMEWRQAQPHLDTK